MTKTIETEAELIAALSEKGRYLEYTGRYLIRTSKDGTSHASVEGKADFIVTDELGDAWTDARDHTSPEYGPWCSTWVLPDFWPWPIETPDNSG